MSSERDEEIRAALAAGEDPAVLSFRYGVSRERIRQIGAAGQRELVAAAAVARAEARAAGGAPTRRDTVAERLAVAALRGNPDERLSEEAAGLIFDGVPENTRKTYRTQWWKFVQWCAATGRDHTPGRITPATIIEWILELGRRPGRYGRPSAPEHIKTSLKTIAAAHRRARRPETDDAGRPLFGYPSPTTHLDVHAAMRGYTKRWLEAGHRPDTAHPLTRAELTRLVLTLDVRTPMGQADAALLSIGYDLGGRRVELANLDIDDLGFNVVDWNKVTTDDYLLVRIPMSKTDQTGEGDEIVLFAHNQTDALTCPVRSAKRWLDALTAAGYVQGAFFRVVNTGGKAREDGGPKGGRISEARIDGPHVAYVVERCVVASKLREGPGRRKHVVPHSLRAGAATEAGAAGADPAALNAHFRWSQSSTTGQKYSRLGLRRSANPMRKAWAADPEEPIEPR